MSHELVKITRRDDGERVIDPVWCLVKSTGEGDRALCSGEVFGFGEGDAEFVTKTVKRGGITCPDCLDYIKEIKALKL